jgi:tryptophan-rich sensory protein
MPVTARAALVLLPGALGYAASAICPPTERAGAGVPFRPPPIAFAIVWPILYALLGWSMYLAKGNCLAAHLVLTAMITAWIPLTACAGRHVEGVWLLVACVLAAGYTIALGDRFTAILLLPLATWLSFATLLAAWSVSLPRQG